MKKAIERLHEYLQEKEISLNSFDLSIGSSNGYIGKQIKNNASVGSDVLQKIFSIYPDINPTWLLTGEGAMLKVVGDEAAKDVVAAAPGGGIPFVEQRVVAGFGGSSFSIGERDVKDWYVIPKFKHKKIDFMIEVEGPSMYPKYNSGDVVACKIIQADRFIQWNKAHVVATKDQGIIIKRIKPGSTDETLTMVSDNENYDPFEVKKEDISGIALVMGVIRLE